VQARPRRRLGAEGPPRTAGTGRRRDRPRDAVARRRVARRGGEGIVMSLRKTLAVGRKEFRQIARDRRSLLVLLFVPAFFLLLYGYALNFDVQHVALAVEDNDRTSASREVVSAFVNSGYFDQVAEVRSDRDAERLIDRGE